ncbi:hypothetical protein Tco_1379646 [Tanacetum coccineum]
MKGITIEEYLAMKDKKMAKQSMNSYFEKLWYLADEDDEEETYVFDMNEFTAIQILNNLSLKSAGTHESLKQFKEYMEIKRRLEVDGVNTDVEFDPPNVEFAKWLTSKFNNHNTMDRYTKNALWLYWKIGDDEEVLTDDEFSNLEEENLREGNEIAEIFRIETDIFLFESPLQKEFKEFNHLLQIDVDVLTGDLPGFKTYEDYKNTWIYKNGIMKCHGLMKNHGWKVGFGRNLLMIYVMNASHFISKVDMLNGLLVTGEKIDIVIEEIYREIFNYKNIGGKRKKMKNQVNMLGAIIYLMMMGDDDDIRDLDNYLILKDAPYYVDEEEEGFKERRSKLLGIPCKKPPTFKSEKFEIIKYSFGLAKEYVAIREYEYDIRVRTEENVSRVYQEIFHKKDEG